MNAEKFQQETLGNAVILSNMPIKPRLLKRGVRALRPDIVITDELSLRDCPALEKAMTSGVQVIATAHFSDISYIKAPFIDIFEKFVVLDTHKIGSIKGIYNRFGEMI